MPFKAMHLKQKCFKQNGEGEIYMRKCDTKVQHLKYKVLREVARPVSYTHLKRKDFYAKDF